MYDTVEFFGAGEQPIKCAAEHPVAGQFQTKDLDCALDTYYVIDGALYVAERVGMVGPDECAISREGNPQETELFLMTKKLLVRSRFSGQVTAYTHCYRCAPVVYRSATRHAFARMDNMQHREPWVQWALGFETGKLVSAKATDKNETREQIRKELVQDGVHVYADDDPHAVVYRESLAQERR